MRNNQIDRNTNKGRGFGEWHRCINPNCKGWYHTDKNKIVDIRCECLERQQAFMRDFDNTLSGLA